jgi:RNA polymerase sigma-70 factor, ECF subfamily
MITSLAPINPLPSRRTPDWPRRESLPPRRRASLPQSTANSRELCEHLFEEHHARLLAVAHRILNSEHDAADAVQDAFVSAFTSLDRFQEKSQLSTWLHRIVVNCCLMKLRASKRRPATSLDLLVETAECTACEGPSAEARHVLLHLEREETRQLVHQAIDRLSADYREIIVLRDIQELDTDTTARLLGISRSAAKTRLHRARQTLRARIERMAPCAV